MHNRDFNGKNQQTGKQGFRKYPTEDEARAHYGTPLNEKEKRREMVIFDLIMDISGSMSKYYEDLVWCFNSILLPGLQGASKTRFSVRLGCQLFSDDIVSPWKGFLSLDEILTNPLKIADLKRTGLGGQTALFRAAVNGIQLTKAVSPILRPKAVPPLCKVFILTDGANNLPPHSPSEVANAIKSFGKPTLFQVAIAYFKTNDGLSEDAFKKMANEAGIGKNRCYFADLTNQKMANNLDLQKKEFRRYFEIFSSDFFLGK